MYVSPLTGNTSNFSAPFRESNTDPGSIALAFYSGIYAYGGANTLNCMTEEVKNPNRLRFIFDISLNLKSHLPRF